ncbi:MAG: hypothetical protein JWM51_302 [Microbacteriaceae bacterium]|nr:hypothetical protein [Microbacteriaceae bacterium]
MLLSIVLALEAFLVFFVTLVVFGLRELEPALAFGGGIALIAALAVASRLLRYSWGIWIGWALQVVLLATGFLVPLMFFIAACFIALWIFCVVRGRQIDQQKAEYLANNPSTPETPGDTQ